MKLVRKHVDHVPVHRRGRNAKQLGQLRDRARLAVNRVEDQLFRAVIELALVDDGHPGVFADGDGGGTGTGKSEPVIVINEGGCHQSSGNSSWGRSTLRPPLEASVLTLMLSKSRAILCLVRNASGGSVVSVGDAVLATELDRHLRAVSAEVRLSGSPEEARAFDYIQDQLELFGFEVQRFESEALIGYPQRAALHILGHRPSELPANGYSLSPSTGPEGVTGDLVYVGAGMPTDYAGLDVRGKIVLSDGLAMPAKARAASLAGALGQVHINDEHIHEMCISPVWGTPTPETGAAAAERAVGRRHWSRTARS